MIYRLHAELRFATVTQRNTALSNIPGSVALTRSGSAPTLFVDRADPSAINIQSAYTTVTGTTALAGSFAHWHACYHGDLAQVCVPTGRKDW